MTSASTRAMRLRGTSGTAAFAYAGGVPVEAREMLARDCHEGGPPLVTRSGCHRGASSKEARLQCCTPVGSQPKEARCLSVVWVGEQLDQLAAPPDADALRSLAGRIDALYREPVCGVVESMTGVRLVHDTLEQEGWALPHTGPEFRRCGHTCARWTARRCARSSAKLAPTWPPFSLRCATCCRTFRPRSIPRAHAFACCSRSPLSSEMPRPPRRWPSSSTICMRGTPPRCSSCASSPVSWPARRS
jgi:hypothetical protein